MPDKTIKTVADLKSYLKEKGMTPEKLGPIVKISNMTIRRLLEKPDSTLIPGKYETQFATLTGGTQNPFPMPGHEGFEAVIENLEKEGSKLSSPEGLGQELKKKLLENLPGGNFRQYVEVMWRVLSGSPRVPLKLKWVAAGALLYFINPMDLIPDSLPGVGFIDDYATLSIAMSYLASQGISTLIEKIESPLLKKP